VDCGHAVEVFVDGAHQDLTPETIDGLGGLAFLQEPIEHTDALEIGAARALALQRQKGARDGELIGLVEKRHGQKRIGEVKRGREAPAAERRNAAAGLDEVELPVEANVLADSEALIEVEEVDAAAEQHMLAVIDGFDLRAGRAGNRIGSGATAKEGARLEQVDLETSTTERGRGRQSGEPAAGDENFRHGLYFACRPLEEVPRSLPYLVIPSAPFNTIPNSPRGTTVLRRGAASCHFTVPAGASSWSIKIKCHS